MTNLHRSTNSTVIFATIIGSILVLRFVTRPKVSEGEFSRQVLLQYMRYFCPHEGVCTEAEALAQLKNKFPNIYQEGFAVLEDHDQE